jgi:hypothetical protein
MAPAAGTVRFDMAVTLGNQAPARHQPSVQVRPLGGDPDKSPEY